MSIDFHLANFPALCQNNEDPGHEFPDVNAGMDCVPTSIAAALTWFTGQQYFGDEVIDAVYGASYQGGTAAVNFEDYCAARGVKLFPIDGAPADLVAQLHSLVHLNKPVLVTVPGQWNNPATSGQNPGDVTHVMVVCGDGPGALQMMNPWTGAFEEYSDAWCEVKLCFGQIWPMEGHMVPDGWSDDGTWLTASNGIRINTGMRTYILEKWGPWIGAWPRENIPLAPEYECNLVDPTQPDLGGGTRIDFLYWSLIWSRSKNAIGLARVGPEMAALKAQPASPVDLSAIAADLSDALAKVQAAQKAATAPASGGAGAPTYVVQEDDTLEAVAAALGVNAHHLYQQNLAAIEAAAQEHGYARGSNNGALLVAGTVLRYS